MNVSRVIYFLLVIMMSTPSCAHAQVLHQVCFKDYCFKVELADRAEDRQRGLQFRSSLGNDQGMLFVFPVAAKHAFWMKDTLIPLDIIWMDLDKRVVFIEANAKPCKTAPCASFVPSEDALYVLEINAGLATLNGLQIGDPVNFSI